jgi:hypothetical protein
MIFSIAMEKQTGKPLISRVKSSPPPETIGQNKAKLNPALAENSHRS